MATTQQRRKSTVAARPPVPNRFKAAADAVVIRSKSAKGPAKSSKRASPFSGKVSTATVHSKGKKLLVSFRDKDGLLGVTRATVRKLALELDLKETQVVHFALKRLAETVLPAYEADDGLPTDQQIATIRRLAGRQEIKSVSSTLL